MSTNQLSDLQLAEVAGQGRQQPGHQRGPQARLLLRERVADDHHLPAEVVLGQAERVERRRPDERIGRRLDVAHLSDEQVRELGRRVCDAAMPHIRD